MKNYDDIVDNLYPTWHAKAACNGKDPAIWFPLTPPHRDARERVTAEAKRICGSCPVRRQCADEAARNGEQYGIWGGNDHEFRKANDDAA